MEESAGHAFISYVREDSGRVDELQRDLQVAGIPVWRDTADLWPGQDWRTMIRRAITANALVFLACFSSQSVSKKKSYQNEELALAIEQLRLRRPDDPWLIPVRLDDCQVPDLDIGAGRTLGSIQRADLFGDRYEEGMKRLITIIQRLLGQQSEEQHMADARQADILRLQAEEQRTRESAERQRAEASKVFVWEERLSQDPRVSQVQRVLRGGQPQPAITAHVKNGGDRPVYDAFLVWHRGSARWGDNDNLGTLIPGREAERTRGLPPLPDYVDPAVWGAVLFSGMPAKPGGVPAQMASLTK